MRNSLKATPAILAFLAFAVAGLMLSPPSLAQEVSSEARRHMYRGEAAMEMAESKTDFQEAVREFTSATQFAPKWADAWFNLGVAQEKAEDFGGAMGFPGKKMPVKERFRLPF